MRGMHRLLTFFASFNVYPTDLSRTPTASPQNLVPPFPMPVRVRRCLPSKVVLNTALDAL